MCFQQVFIKPSGLLERQCDYIRRVVDQRHCLIADTLHWRAGRARKHTSCVIQKTFRQIYIPNGARRCVLAPLRIRGADDLRLVPNGRQSPRRNAERRFEKQIRYRVETKINAKRAREKFKFHNSLIYCYSHLEVCGKRTMRNGSGGEASIVPQCAYQLPHILAK